MNGLQELWELTKREGKMFGGSTSSLTGMLSQVYFLISGMRTPDTSPLSQPFYYMVRVLREFLIGPAHLTTRQAWRLYTWTENACLGPFKSQ